MTAKILNIADYIKREQTRLDAHSGQPFCGPCYDKTGFVSFLQRHKVWGGDVGLHCIECGSEFDV